MDLEPRFLRLGTEYDKVQGYHVTHHYEVDSITEAQGVMFLCPKCFFDNGGRIGTHMVVCWSAARGIPDEVRPGPGRWKLEGSKLEDLTLGKENGKSRSIQIGGTCGWHGYVTNGIVTDAS